jgi:hypothetical protein
MGGTHSHTKRPSCPHPPDVRDVSITVLNGTTYAPYVPWLPPSSTWDRTFTTISSGNATGLSKEDEVSITTLVITALQAIAVPTETTVRRERGATGVDGSQVDDAGGDAGQRGYNQSQGALGTVIANGVDQPRDEAAETMESRRLPARSPHTTGSSLTTATTIATSTSRSSSAAILTLASGHSPSTPKPHLLSNTEPAIGISFLLLLAAVFALLGVC